MYYWCCVLQAGINQHARQVRIIPANPYQMKQNAAFLLTMPNWWHIMISKW